MQNKDAKQSKHPAQAMTAAQVADRMGLTTRQLQDLRLRGIGPPIVQRGLSIHYELADVMDIERHEAVAIMEQVLASDWPLTLLRAMAEHGGFKLSPILQQVCVPIPSPVTEPIPVPETPAPSELPEPARVVIAPAAEPEPPPATPPMLTVISSDEPAILSTKSSALSTESWYLVHTKLRQEDVALANLQRQGYACYLPQMRIERIRRRKAEVATEPMFPRYLFIRLDSSDQGKSWSPIRSTLGVSQLVHFGARAAKVDDALVDLLRQREQAMPLDAMFHSGDSVIITDGPFAGIEAIYQMADADRRAFILLEILSKPVSMQIDTGRLRKAG
jgi:transcriptional antiterminator RfaH